MIKSKHMFNIIIQHKHILHVFTKLCELSSSVMNLSKRSTLLFVCNGRLTGKFAGTEKKIAPFAWGAFLI